MKIIKFWILCGILICAFALCEPFPVYAADVAPPDWTPGANPQPGSPATQVRMEAETVVIDIQSSQRKENYPAWAKVTAEFTMRNLGQQVEKLAVRFPLTNMDGDGFGGYPEIQDLTAAVNGKPIRVSRKTEEYIDAFDRKAEIAWGVFDVNFPVNEPVNIKVTYTVEGVGYYPTVEFKYLLQTGAGWEGTIGVADLYVRLPYEISPENVVYYDLGYWTSTTTGGVSKGNEIHWRYEDLEPDPKSDLLVTITAPQAWQKVLKARSEVKRNPKDGEAWGRLGKSLKEAAWAKRGFRSDPGGQQMISEALNAYDQAVTLLPGDALWHFGYAELLYNHYFYDYYWYPDIDDPALLVKALEELQVSLKLDPNNPQALELAEWIAMDLNNTIDTSQKPFVFLALTTTPTRQFTSTAIAPVEETPSPLDTATSQPKQQVTNTLSPLLQATQENTPTSVNKTTPKATEPSSDGPTPFCGSILFTLFVVLWRVLVKGV